MKKLLVCLALAALMGSAYGQSADNFVGQPVITNPANTGTNGTVATGGTMPQPNNLVLAASTHRKGCIIQNQGTHNMIVGVTSTVTNGLIIPGEVNGLPSSLNCAQFGIVMGDAIYMSGTTGDAYVIWWQ